MLKKLGLLLSIIFSIPGFGFTLIQEDPHRFSSSKATIHITEDSCEQIGLTNQELHQMVFEAAIKSWGRVASTSLHFIMGKKLEISAKNLNSIFSISDFEGKIPVDSIVVGCTKDLIDFEKNRLDMAAAYTTISGKHFILINDSYKTGFWDLNKTGKIGVLIHNLGHAIGLGHPQASVSSVMSYFTHNSGGDNWNVLFQDDQDGVTYLYPKK